MSGEFPTRLAHRLRQSNPWCQAGPILEARGHAVCTGRTEHLHHRRMRSSGGIGVEANALPCCHACHAVIHANPHMAHSLGFILRAGDPDWVDCGALSKVMPRVLRNPRGAA